VVGTVASSLFATGRYCGRCCTHYPERANDRLDWWHRRPAWASCGTEWHGVRMGNEMRPLSRRENLIVQEMGDELLVYDLEHHKAHSLNATASLVWRNCDGETSFEQLVGLMSDQAPESEADNLVRVGLHALERARLVTYRSGHEPARSGCTRRELAARLAKVGTLSLVVPVVVSISAPTPAQAASCRPYWYTCTAGYQCCSRNCTGGRCR
jgi:hypothetical protein